MGKYEYLWWNYFRLYKRNMSEVHGGDFGILIVYWSLCKYTHLVVNYKLINTLQTNEIVTPMYLFEQYVTFPLVFWLTDLQSLVIGLYQNTQNFIIKLPIISTKDESGYRLGYVLN